MNKLIQVLMEQAMELVDPYSLEGEFGPRRLNEEKFAELIVQECCALIAPSQEHGDDASLPYIGGAEGVELLNGSVRLIKEHFGVE